MNIDERREYITKAGRYTEVRGKHCRPRLIMTDEAVMKDTNYLTADVRRKLKEPLEDAKTLGMSDTFYSVLPFA